MTLDLIRYTALEEELYARFPEAKAETEQLIAEMVDPRSAGPDEIWPVLWSKPLYSNTRDEIGTRYVEKLRPLMQGTWLQWGHDEHAFRITLSGKGRKADAFYATGAAQAVQNATGIAWWRLHAIQGGATALRRRTGLSEKPYADLVAAPLSLSVQIVRAEMGKWWGHITALHFLTDLGLAVKPDLHLVRSVRFLGMGDQIKAAAVPSPDDSIRINEAVRNLAYKLVKHDDPKTLRRVDKNLMAISKYGLLI